MVALRTFRIRSLYLSGRQLIYAEILRTKQSCLRNSNRSSANCATN